MNINVGKVSVSGERAVVYTMIGVYASMLLSGCKGQQGPETLTTPSPDSNALNLKRQRAMDSLGPTDGKFLGDPLSSFNVNFPAEPDGSKPASTLAGTIFEIKSQSETILNANHLSLGMYVPDGSGTPMPVLVNYVSEDPNSLAVTPVKENNGATVTRYGIAAVPLDPQYLDAFINGDKSINGPVNNYLKKDADGRVIALYNILFSDITPDNVKEFVDSLKGMQDPAQIQEAVLNHIYGVVFNDQQTNRSIIVKLDQKNQKNIKDFIANLFFGSDMVAQAKGLSASELTAQAATPVVTPTEQIKPSPTPATVEINGGSYTQLAGRDFEAFDSTGKLAYVKDTQGNWIKLKTPYVEQLPMDSGDALAGRLGSNYALNSDKTGITNVDGLKIDISKGTATFNFDGTGEETFSTVDIHVITKDVNGKDISPILTMGGYKYNTETKKWEVYNPGFPMNIPKDQLSWMNQNDVANGNWLRWDQRATSNVDWNKVFANVMTPFRWEVKNQTGLVWPNWVNDKLEAMKTDPRFQGVSSKDIYGGHGGETYAYLVDKGCVLISFDALNNNGAQTNGKVSVTHLPSIMDELTWLQHRKDANFTRIAFAAGKPWDASMAKETDLFDVNKPESWMFWIAIAYPGQTQTPSLGQKDLITMNSADTSMLESEISSSGFDPSASFNTWGGFVRVTLSNK